MKQTEATTVCLGFPAEPKVAAQHSILALPRRGCVKVGQCGATAVGPVFGMSWVARSCQCNGVNALVLRHGAPAPPVTTKFGDFSAAIHDFVVHYGNVAPEVYDGWLDKWPAEKRAAIIKSTQLDAAKPHVLKTFIKREGGHARPRKGRLIQGYGTLHAQELCAREFAVYQKGLTAMFGVGGYELRPGVFVTFGSGMSATDICDWARRGIARCVGMPVFYERDGKNWDSTMQRPHHDLKLKFARAVSAQLANFMDRSYKCTGVARFGTGHEAVRLVYRLEGTVKSGHNDTSSSNSLINAAISAEVFSRLGLRASVIVAGDDMLAIVDGDFDVKTVVGEEAKFGIVPEAAKFYDINDVTFISACFLAQGEDLVFVPVLGRLLLRLWWTTKPPKKHVDDYMHGVACGLLPAVGGVALYRDLVSIGLKRSVVAHDRMVAFCRERWRHSAFYGVAQGGDGFESALAVRYGCSVKDIREFAKFLRGLPAQPSFANHPLADAIISRDVSEVTGRVGALRITSSLKP